MKIKNPGLKVLSLVIALLFCFHVHSEMNSSVISFIVPVEVKNLPPEKIVLLPTLRQAQVTVRGPSFLVSRLATSAPSFKVQLPEEVGNQIEVALQEKDLAMPPSVEVVSIEPGALQLILDDLVVRSIPVRVPTIGEIDEYTTLKGITVDPQTVNVRGPSTELVQLKTIETVPVDLRGIKEKTTRTIELRPAGKYSRAVSPRVTVTVDAESIQAERTLEGLSIETRANNGSQYSISPGKVSVELSGPKEVIDALSPEGLLPFVRIPEGTADGSSLEIEFELPDSVAVVFAKPSTVVVRQEAKKQ